MIEIGDRNRASSLVRLTMEQRLNKSRVGLNSDTSRVGVRMGVNTVTFQVGVQMAVTTETSQVGATTYSTDN